MDGSERSRILYLQGLVSADLTAAKPEQMLVPYLSLSAGLMHDANAVGASTPWTGAIDLMAGARVRISDRWFVAPEAGLGVTSSVYTRFGVTVGFRP